MGLRMDDIHAPTVSSGPTSRYATAKDSNRDPVPLMDLFAEKDRVEGEISALSSVLDSHGVNMNTSLTTFDGYPRDDLDIAQIRTTRARIIYLRNDYKGLMSRIETGLHDHHASLKAIPAQNSSHAFNGEGGSTSADSSHLEIPFAKVNSVVSNSPADDAGLKAGDAIRRFGNVNWINNEKLSKVAETVQKNEGRNITVKVMRQSSSDGSSEEVQLHLVPRRVWGGRGMLGCHLLPI